ncbi:pilus assembly protein [Bacillus sp. S3]|uniref:TadE/TadG family type IV pilus assembly protein n=1 Tax=Bacillus sp. S3 TaxID=486398 RepID=UPI00118D1492|nr:TadE/TadG family type IV pilus assembly protein [Bacillus sp. S3]QCJ44027.1 pilus assembly protein [Bacillus sp. S3]
MKSEKGQSLVEFALIVPVLILLLLGIMDFARIFHAYLTIDHAGREAARAASIGKTKSEAEKIGIDSGSSINLTKPNGSVTVTTGSPGANATVTITYPITFLTPVIGSIVGPITLTDTTVMRVE